jgi:hypothetical protein
MTKVRSADSPPFRIVERRKKIVAEMWTLSRCGPTRELLSRSIWSEIEGASWLLSEGRLREAAPLIARAIKWMAYFSPAWLWDEGLNSYLPCLKEPVVLDSRYFAIHEKIFGSFRIYDPWNI